MDRIFAVMLGGAAGALARYSVYLLVEKWTETHAPLATWIANLTGCLLIGFLAPFMNVDSVPLQWRLFILVGFLGSFTTFSTFSLESVVLWQGRKGRPCAIEHCRECYMRYSPCVVRNVYT